ncbi:hypothetical protein FQR65_LT20907 [Abscondita terminalis]|nr:hypothetical protein FQR65_LT20907 [Abscondita terminalis]
MRVEASGREVQLELQLNREGANRAQVNRNAVRQRELTRWFASVSFVPEDLNIVRGEPAGRRRFLDDALMARHPVAAGALSDYERVLRQRTSLLKSARGRGRAAVEATLGIWDDQLVEFGTQIILARRELVRDLREPLEIGYRQLVDQDHGPTLRLSESVRGALASGDVSRETRESGSGDDVSRETLAEQFRTALHTVREREFERGVSLVGPHRDDLVLELNGLPVKGYASHGESWSFALSLKVALAEILRQESPAGDPVIILDDVFAELDARRRERLMSAVSDFEQGDPDFASEAYLRAKSVWKGVPARRRKKQVDAPGGKAFGPGRDPKALSDVLVVMAGDMGWSVELEQARLLSEWREFAGDSTADHTTVVGISQGVLQIQCDSTAWATELRRLRGEMLTRLLRDYPDAEIRDLRFLAPGAPQLERNGSFGVRRRF